MISESQIKAAIRKVTAKEKSMVELKDDGARSSGRLMFRARRVGDRIIAEFYAVYYRAERRCTAKIANHDPEGRTGGMSLGDARKRFREEFAGAISAGAEPESVATRHQARNKPGTVEELFRAYVDSLRAGNKRSAYNVERILLTGSDNAADHLGRDSGASSIDAAAISGFLARIYSRGAPSMAAVARSFIGAAFRFGMKAEHDYRRRVVLGTAWGLKSNPVDAIPFDADAFRARDRFLAPAELRTFWEWLSAYEKTKSRLAPALRLAACTGQRIEEILRVTTTVYERPPSMLSWERTKNGRPHSIPLPHQAVAIIDALPANRFGLYFPNDRNPERPSPGTTLPDIVATFLDAHPEIPHFVPKDLRRTFKTLAASSGISKEMLDRLQNHARRDISSVHYLKYDYLAEKRDAMVKWAAYLDLVLSGRITEIGQRDAVVVSIGRGKAA